MASTLPDDQRLPVKALLQRWRRFRFLQVFHTACAERRENPVDKPEQALRRKAFEKLVNI